MSLRVLSVLSAGLLAVGVISAMAGVPATAATGPDLAEVAALAAKVDASSPGVRDRLVALGVPRSALDSIPALARAAPAAVVMPRTVAFPTGCEGAATAGDDTITCADSLKPGDVLDTGGGDDKIVINGDVPKGATVNGGAGRDTITAFSVGELRCGPGWSPPGGLVDGGEDDDMITIGGGPSPGDCATADRRGTVGDQAVVTGGSGDDTLTAGAVGYIWGDDADPPKSIAVSAGRLDGGPGDDKVKAAFVGSDSDPTKTPHPEGGVYGGEGEDQVDIGQLRPLSSVHGGPGADTMTAKDLLGGAYLDGDEGNDTLTAPERVTGDFIGGHLAGGDGDDSITIADAFDSIQADGNGGNDRIRVDRANVGTVHAAAAGHLTDVYAGEGDDVISIGTVGFGVAVDGEQGDDTITVDELNGPADMIHPFEDKAVYHKASHRGRIAGSDGNDTITVGVMGLWAEAEGDGTLNANRKPESVVPGEDRITVGRLTGFGKVHGGGKNDTIAVNEADTGQRTVLDDEMSSGCVLENIETGCLTGGDGDDEITFGALAGDTLVATEGGNDTITVTGAMSGNVGIIAGDGDDVMSIASTAENNGVFGEAGADRITVTGDNAGTLSGDEGDDTITVSGKNTGPVDGGEGTDTCPKEGKSENCESSTFH